MLACVELCLVGLIAVNRSLLSPFMGGKDKACWFHQIWYGVARYYGRTLLRRLYLNTLSLE